MDSKQAIEQLIEEFQELRRELREYTSRMAKKEFYTTEEFARLVNMKPKTIRDNCNSGRLKGQKKGHSNEWALPHSELERFASEGLRSAGE